MDPQNKNKVAKEYETQADKIVSQMLQVLLRAQRKKDDVAYRKTLAKLQ